MTSPASPAPEPSATVRFLETVGPTATDRQVYDAGSDWTVSLERAQQLEADGLAEITALSEPPAPVEEEVLEETPTEPTED